MSVSVPGELQGLILSMDDIKICRNSEGKKYRLGEGGFGVVYKALMNNVDEVALKAVKVRNVFASVSKFTEFIFKKC